MNILYPQVYLEVLAFYKEALDLLEFEKAQAILADDIIFQETLAKYPDNYRVICEKLTEESYTAAVAKGNRELLNAVDIDIKRFKKLGEWQQCLKPDILPTLTASVTLWGSQFNHQTYSTSFHSLNRGSSVLGR